MAEKLEWQMAIREVGHACGVYPVFEWTYGTAGLVAFRVQAWPQGFLVFKESREDDKEAFRTADVDNLLVWMKSVKKWEEDPPRIREVWAAFLETKARCKNTIEFFRVLWERLRVFCPAQAA